MKFYSILKKSKDSKGCNVVTFFFSLGTSTITTSQSWQGGDKGGVWHLRLASFGALGGWEGGMEPTFLLSYH